MYALILLDSKKSVCCSSSIVDCINERQAMINQGYKSNDLIIVDIPGAKPSIINKHFK